MNWLPGWDTIAGAGWWSNFYFWAGIIGLLALGVSEVVSHRYTERKDELAAEERRASDRRYNEEIARLQLETAVLTADAEKSRADIADANARALEARAELERYKAPRRLTGEAKAELAGKLEPIKGTKFALSAVGPEPIDLAIDTADALMAAGLVWIDWPMQGNVTNLPGRHTVGNIQLFGTVVRTYDPQLVGARDAIAAALKAPEFQGTNVEPVEPPISGFDAVLIMIGTKR